MRGTALLAIVLTVVAASCGGPRRPNVLVISLDGLRPDRIGAYGAAPSLSPAIDTWLGQEGTRFSGAYSAAPDGPAATMSLFTGFEPCRHGVTARDGALAPGLRTLAELLGDAGYATGGFTDGTHVLARAGFARGFQTWSETGPGAADAFTAAGAWLRGQTRRSWFAFVHSAVLHVPPRQEPGGVKSYDDLIAPVDTLVGDLLGSLRDADLLDDTIVVLTAGHGEQLGEHGLRGHGNSLYDTLLRVPLFVRAPRAGVKAGMEVEWWVSLIDMVPTIFGLLELPVPPTNGTSLVPLLQGEAPAPRFLFADDGRGAIAARQIVSTRLKIIGRLDAPDFQLFQVGTDPGELKDISKPAPATTFEWIGAEGNLALGRGIRNHALARCAAR